MSDLRAKCPCGTTLSLKGATAPAGTLIRFKCPRCGLPMQTRIPKALDEEPRPSDYEIAEMLRSMKLPDYMGN